MVELSTRSKKDNELFKSHLMLPFLYFNFINKQYTKSLAKVPYDLGGIVKKINDLLWRSMKRDTKTDMLSVYGGIPPQYLSDALPVTGKKEQVDTLMSLCTHFERFLATGVTLYISSPFETSAMIAGSKLCKEAYRVFGGVQDHWKMVCYPALLDIQKDFKSAERGQLTLVEELPFLVLYMVGREYATDFSMAHLKGLIAKRKMENKVTVVCSHLSLEEFQARYDSSLCMSALEFTDANEVDNFKALRRVVES